MGRPIAAPQRAGALQVGLPELPEPLQQPPKTLHPCSSPLTPCTNPFKPP